ncbi:uncharacterized protein LOC142584823 [Dermacentor variabilis]|uniref:uncharacterized protein LOC142584823 n=1 Tax=Dermacentor variabilis TaxID=34621 RepID=UPI003F5BB458
MPTNAELARKIEEMEAKFSKETDRFAHDVFGKVLLRMQSSGIDVKELKNEIEGLKQSMKILNGVVEILRSEKAVLAADNKNLESDNCALSEKVEELEKYSRTNKVEIKGIPCTLGENCVAVLQKVGEKIGCSVTPAELDIVPRVPTKVRDKKNVIARFCSRSKKNEFIGKARRAKLCLGDLGITVSINTPVYVNDHLTPQNKSLFTKALALNKGNNWKFLWTDNCLIKAKKSTDSQVYRTASESDLSFIIYTPLFLRLVVILSQYVLAPYNN